jgi:hypothetical protein
MGKGSCGRVACRMAVSEVLARTGARCFVGDPQVGSRMKIFQGPSPMDLATDLLCSFCMDLAAGL